MADNPGLSRLQFLARELKLDATPDTPQALKEKYQPEVDASNKQLGPLIGHYATVLARGDGVWRSELLFNKQGIHRGEKVVQPSLEREIADSLSGQFQGADLHFTPADDIVEEGLYYPRLDYRVISKHSAAPGQITSVHHLVNVFDTQLMFDKDRDLELQQEALEFLYSPESRRLLQPHARSALLTLLAQETTYISRALQTVGYDAMVSKMEDDPDRLKLLDTVLNCVRAGFPSDQTYELGTKIAYLTEEPYLNSQASVLTNTKELILFHDMRIKDACMGSRASINNNYNNSEYLTPYLMAVSDNIPEQYVFIPCVNIGSVHMNAQESSTTTHRNS